MKLIVKSIRYFETNRGIGYDAKTQFGSIMNDGNGGATYFEHNGTAESKAFRNTPSGELEEAIDIYEV